MCRGGVGEYRGLLIRLSKYNIGKKGQGFNTRLRKELKLIYDDYT
jgi:hypothetical protein